jgi:hypothetical protein
MNNRKVNGRKLNAEDSASKVSQCQCGEVSANRSNHYLEMYVVAEDWRRREMTINVSMASAIVM